MRAVTVAPGTTGSARLEEVPEPDPARVLAAADRSRLEQLVTRQVRPDQVQQALARAPAGIKVMGFAPP